MQSSRTKFDLEHCEGDLCWSRSESEGRIERAECHLHRGGGLGNKRKFSAAYRLCAGGLKIIIIIISINVSSPTTAQENRTKVVSNNRAMGVNRLLLLLSTIADEYTKNDLPA